VAYVNQHLTKEDLDKLTSGRVFGTSIPRVSKVWFNQLRVQDMFDGKMTLLSGIHIWGVHHA